MSEGRKLAFWVTVFFAFGVSVALAVVIPAIDRGVPGVVVGPFGAMAGGYSAWFVFFLALRFRHWKRGRSNSSD